MTDQSVGQGWIQLLIVLSGLTWSTMSLLNIPIRYIEKFEEISKVIIECFIFCNIVIFKFTDLTKHWIGLPVTVQWSNSSGYCSATKNISNKLFERRDSRFADMIFWQWATKCTVIWILETDPLAHAIVSRLWLNSILWQRCDSLFISWRQTFKWMTNENSSSERWREYLRQIWERFEMKIGKRVF
jgi:hypothetical protein